ncbi:DNA repair protein RecO [Neogemmobacter tilapiae]|uniref:DNA repair protein RecO n=1 Tax=Neogemmobacter tilapiae TaxID=875041 RepID=A0A918TYD8_9RHOB|nr:DNA repair protein RecO [Gemmobacter tilapiae]GHC64523.1 DNA repair protein RecO [Gemmobacter tilapiae]
MDWQDQGIVLSVRPHGENAAILEVFTAEHGRHLGVVRGGISRKMTPFLQPGNDLALSWRARLEDHLGVFVAEPERLRSALMADRLALLGLNTVTGLLRLALAERDPHPDLWWASRALLDQMQGQGWAAAYLGWELGLLAELGFSLDLSCCAVTGTVADLVYVSPKTGRAVSRGAAGEWAERLLPLPLVLRRLASAEALGPVEAIELAQGFAITGHFLEKALGPVLVRRGLPDARAALVGRLCKGV